MADDPSRGTNFPDIDSLNFLLSDTSDYLWSDQPNLDKNWLPPDLQSLEGASTSKLDLDWGYMTPGDDSAQGSNGRVGVYNSNDCWSGASEGQSQTSVHVGLRRHNLVEDKDESIRKSFIGRKNVDNSITNIVTGNIFPSVSNNATRLVDEDPLECEDDDIQSESTINLKDETCEMNFQEPKLGMLFSSEEEAYKFYINYAAKIGFKVRKGKIQRLTDRTIRKRSLFCSKQGFRSENKSGKTRKYERKETRTGCRAMVQFTHDTDIGNWEITHLVLGHNHETNGPNQRHITSPPVNISEEDARISKISKAEMVKETSLANLPVFPSVDGSNYLRVDKINILPPEDCQSLVNFLKHLQLEDPSFFHTVQLDAQSRIINFFWSDVRSKIDYEYFGDVLILDTTIRIDKYDIICAPFLGLNHHRQYVLFGCGFLLDHSKDSFVWLLSTFVEAMGNRHPKTIFTDEHQAVSDAINVVVPETQHCLGMWYISHSARKHLSASFRQPCFEDMFNKCIFGCKSEEEFSFMWDSLFEMNKLRENPWLNTLYRMRNKWSHVFNKGTYSAGIGSRQRCENIPYVFHNLMSETITLSKFVQQYLIVAEQRRREELYEDCHCKESERPMILGSTGLEKHAADVYTSKIFKLFQEELRGCLSLVVEEIANDGRIFMFKITDEGHQDNFVEFNCSELKVICSCKKYESIGILCAHAIKVLEARNIVHIPSHYILKRWTKSAKEDHKQGIIDESQGTSSLFTSRLMHNALNVINKADDHEKQKIVANHLEMALKEVEYVPKTKKTGHLHGKDVEIHYKDGDPNGIDCMETQGKVLTPPRSSQQEVSLQHIEAGFKRKDESEVIQTDRKSNDDAITHYRPHKEARKVGDDQGSRARSGSPHSVGENSQKQPCMPTENVQEILHRLEQEISKIKEKIGEPSTHLM